MLKTQQLPTSTNYKNSAGEKAFVGARVEGENRVTAVRFDIPLDPIVGCEETDIQYASITVKISVPDTSTDYDTQLAAANAYVAANVLGATLLDVAEGPIELDITDIV